MAMAICVEDRAASPAAADQDWTTKGGQDVVNPYAAWCPSTVAYPLGVWDGGAMRAATEDEVLDVARRILRGRLNEGPIFDAPWVVKDYLRVHCAGLEHEVFMVVFVDAQHRLIALEEIFRGTVNQTSVYPREIVKAALTHNASAVLLAHNHPSGCETPSRADEFLTQKLKEALSLVDVKVLDHLVVTDGAVVSFVERGLL